MILKDQRAIDGYRKLKLSLEEFASSAERAAAAFRKANADIHDTMNDIASRQILRAMNRE
jgi:hypothetical protein